MLTGPLGEIMGREARANPTAVAAKAGELSGDKVRTKSDDEAYLGFLARQINSLEQFDAMIEQTKPRLRNAVRLQIWTKLRPDVQKLIPDPTADAQ